MIFDLNKIEKKLNKQKNMFRVDDHLKCTSEFGFIHPNNIRKRLKPGAHTTILVDRFEFKWMFSSKPDVIYEPTDPTLIIFV